MESVFQQSPWKTSPSITHAGRASLTAQLVKNPPAMQETSVQFLGWEDPLEKGKATHSSILGLPLVAQLVKNLSAMREDLGSIPGLGRYLGEGKGYPLQYSGLENFMDCTLHGVTKSRTRLSDFHTCRARGTSLLLPRRRIHEVCSLDSCKRDRPPASPSSLGLLSKVPCPQVPAIDHHGDGVPGCPGWALLLC